ncbi:MAG: RNA polymerase sigma factor [Planctomycetota bacterium]
MHDDSNRMEREQWVREAVARYERPLMLYAARFVGVERARDVVQEAFLRMWRADRSAVEDHLARWLYTVCRNKALDDLRKDGRMRALGEVDVAHEPTGTERRTRPESDEQHHAVLELLEELPERQQEILRLKFQGGLSYKEIADVMGLTISHVGVLIHNAIKTVRGRIDQVDASANTAVSR